MLNCLHYDGCSYDEALRRWKVEPETIDSASSFTLKSIFNETHTGCFGFKELELDGDYALNTSGSFFVAVIYSGGGTIMCGGKEYSFTQGDAIFFSAAIQEVIFKSKILFCYPPM